MTAVKQSTGPRGSKQLIGVDWGTTSFRAYLMDERGRVLDRREAADGILSVEDFDACFENHCGLWVDSYPRAPILLSGMIGSRQGWVEVPYCPCPAGAEEIAARLTRHATSRGRQIAFVPGLSWRSTSGADDVMRGEETQIIGVSGAGRQVMVLPGSHSKWVEVVDGRILRFATFLTGEFFAAMSKHTILGRLMTGDAHDARAFEAGIAASAEAGGLLHHLFRVRTGGLFSRWPAESLSSLLSGIAIGHEIRGARDFFGGAERVLVVGGATLAARYAEALAVLGLSTETGPPDAAARGLARLAERMTS
ncbi:MAG: 2-dehydro-3-deoxygalactonokinase [Alphaproteobacteria bacterium]|nr:2-dehydro-3-deoxygalactonokinase [Alphaproteobacteria bacterium]